MPESRDWADLPEGITNLISKKLTLDPTYFLSFRAVCKNWRSSSSVSDLPLQLPWLLERNRNGKLGSKLRFYSLVGGETGTIHVPEPYRRMVYYGPGHGYLLVSSLKRGLFLLNPLVGHVIPLPKLKDGVRIGYPGFSGSDPLHNWHVSCPCEMRVSGIDEAAIATYRADQNDWTYAYVRVNKFSKLRNACWDGKVFATQIECSTAVFDSFSGQTLYGYGASHLMDEAKQGSLAFATYLVESCGEILRVTWYAGSGESEEFGAFEIYKIQSVEVGLRKIRSWVKISDIGDQIVFLDRVNGFSMRAPDGSRGNCIYFLYGAKPARYDLGTRQVEMLPCPFKNCTWFIPKLG